MRRKGIIVSLLKVLILKKLIQRKAWPDYAVNLRSVSGR
jgi:hypothetical protein